MMATLQSSEQKNNLELYLNDVYEKECKFKIKQEEVEFIQTGIEILVQDVVDDIIADGEFDKLISDIIYKDSDEDEDSDEDFDKNPDLTYEMYDKKNIVEVYFPIRSDCSLRRYVAENASCVKSVKSTIIKVGSFYDETKNNFPDEFDFIFPLLGARTSDLPKLVYDFSTIRINGLDPDFLRYPPLNEYPPLSDKQQVTPKLEFVEVIDLHGPACKLQFIYSNGFGEKRPIHVDLVPAFKIIDSNFPCSMCSSYIDTRELFSSSVRSYYDVEPKTFREEILSAESCLYVEGDLAYTEIEQHFMKNILSKKHVKVYRILKYLLNGHGDGEECKERFDVSCYTSYRIKTLMIYHHEACTNTDTGDLGPCVLQVLQELSKYNDPSNFPRFNNNWWYAPKFPMLQDLNSTIKTLQSMQTSENSYNYERDKIESVSRQYLDSIGTRQK